MPSSVLAFSLLVMRSFLLNLAFYGWTALLCVVCLGALVLPRKSLFACMRLWLGGLHTIEHSVGGIRATIVGYEHLPPKPYIVAAKHQSAWETFTLARLLDQPAIVLKAELMRLPLWGWYASRAGMIPVDRAGRRRALTRMLRAARQAADEGRALVIFPQGTRVAPGAKAPYHVGVAALYQALALPVVPVAVNSGRLWPKNSFLKRPGVVTLAFLPPIPPGLPRTVFMERLETTLESASARLLEPPTL